MPTIADIAKSKKVIAIHGAFLRNGEMAVRRLYATHEFGQWYRSDLRRLDEGFAEPILPSEQVDVRLRQFVLGAPQILPRTQLRILRHHVGIVWELKTRDVRIFGAFPEKDAFLMHCGEDATLVKTNGLYESMGDAASNAFSKLADGKLNFIKSGSIGDVISD